ncbi:septum formation protein Maf [Paenibacillus darwinianus]|uniref:dTTP/UTP pyrophosphatase n=2 Tax=Bacillales TaxID=1385 RepID=A0A9W5RZQ4_9BACL|nr:Maf family protein [Paenibacillus darwinianus]EXX85131.1 septum formation protein Maf [Paenibacillus darwinianus]EXX90107.1 septum formation protein Maf [Paenibacillus darwinianus]EXX91350.1 septum formation protein Maf [Paenibacillus darwinianus]
MNNLTDLHGRTPQRLIMASSSPRRRELIQSLGLRIPVTIMASDADESTPADWTPQQIVEALALRKARAVKAMLADVERNHQAPAVVVGADTIVVLDGEMMGKPLDVREAAGMLRRLQGRTHEVYTGVALVSTMDGREAIAHRMTQVHMKPLDLRLIERYVASGEPSDKAGSYAIQGLGATLIDRIEGDYFNVVGLPLSLLSELLGEFGIDVI